MYTVFDSIWTNIEPYDIWYGYISYFDKFDRNGMCTTTTTTAAAAAAAAAAATTTQKSYLLRCLCVLESLTLDTSKCFLWRWKLQKIALLQM